MWQATLAEIMEEAGLNSEWVEQGIEQGIERGKEIMIQNLLKMGMPVDEIALAAELPIERIQKLSSA